MGGFGEETRSGGGLLGGGCAGLGLGRGGAPPLLYRTAASLQARGWMVPGLYSFCTSIPHQSPQMIAASTMITEKGEGELGNVE